MRCSHRRDLQRLRRLDGHGGDGPHRQDGAPHQRARGCARGRGEDAEKHASAHKRSVRSCSARTRPAARTCEVRQQLEAHLAELQHRLGGGGQRALRRQLRARALHQLHSALHVEQRHALDGAAGGNPPGGSARVRGAQAGRGGARERNRRARATTDEGRALGAADGQPRAHAHVAHEQRVPRAHACGGSAARRRVSAALRAAAR
jgi:hypothetical protein